MNNNKSPSGDGFSLLVKNRIKNFWGYGSLQAPVWFIGMEEGYDTSSPQELLQARFEATHNKATVDIRTGMKGVTDHLKWFRSDADVQPTWKYPIALHLYFKNGEKPTKNEIKEYQIHNLADVKKKETATLELMPLPSNKASEKTWLYGKLDIPYLKTRKEYLETYKPTRVEKLRKLIQQHQPKLVIFYSLTYLQDWESIIGSKPVEITDGMYVTQTNGTTYCIIPQSVSFGMSYDRLFTYAAKVLTRSPPTMKSKSQKLLTLPEVRKKVHTEIGKSMGIDFQTRILYGMYKKTKGGYTIKEMMELLRRMVDEQTTPPTRSGLFKSTKKN